MRDLHGDGAEALSDAAGAEVPGDRAKDTMPIEPVVLVEASVLRGDEGGANRLRHDGDRDVYPTNILEVA